MFLINNTMKIYRRVANLILDDLYKIGLHDLTARFLLFSIRAGAPSLVTENKHNVVQAVSVIRFFFFSQSNGSPLASFGEFK